MATVLGRTVAFLQKCGYKWRPRKCPGLDVANLILKNYFEKWRKILENHKIFVFFFSFSEKQFAQLQNFAKNKTLRKLGKGRNFIFTFIFFGARGGWRGVGCGASVRVGLLSGCLFVFFRLLFYFFVLRSNHKSLHEALVCGSRQQLQQPSSLLLFSF